MSRFAPSQPDLFASALPSDAAASPPVDPLGELHAMLVRLRATDVMPWPTISAAMQDEYHALWLAKQAGPAGVDLAALVSNEFERLMALTD